MSRGSRATGRGRSRILLCTPELTRLPGTLPVEAQAVCGKAGGLGDVAAALAGWIADEDRLELHIALPLSARRVREKLGLTPIDLAGLVRSLRERGVHLVRSSAFETGGVYDETDLHCSTARAVAFQAGIVQLLDELEPDLLHAHDWMTGLVPAAAAVRGIPSVFTLHNVYTRQERLSDLFRAGIDVTEFMRELYFTAWPEHAGEAWRGNVADLAASGVFAATRANVVSPGFLRELLEGADHLPASRELRDAVAKRAREGAVEGILNAPRGDAAPEVSSHVRRFCSADLLAGKAANKSELQRRLGLAASPLRPLFLWPNRLVAQKGCDLLLEVATKAVERLGAQIAVVGDGEQHVVARLEWLARRWRGAIGRCAFSTDLGDLGLAGADLLLMPSRYEPCGLPQMEGMRFGTLPVVRRTGGLADTVSELDPERGAGCGFVFEPYDADALYAAMTRAAAFVRAPETLRRQNLLRVREQALERFDPRHCRAAYLALYARVLPALTIPRSRPARRAASTRVQHAG